jgi:hypothetical protein
VPHVPESAATRGERGFWYFILAVVAATTLMVLATDRLLRRDSPPPRGWIVPAGSGAQPFVLQRDSLRRPLRQADSAPQR